MGLYENCNLFLTYRSRRWVRCSGSIVHGGGNDTGIYPALWSSPSSFIALPFSFSLEPTPTLIIFKCPRSGSVPSVDFRLANGRTDGRRYLALCLYDVSRLLCCSYWINCFYKHENDCVSIAACGRSFRRCTSPSTASRLSTCLESTSVITWRSSLVNSCLGFTAAAWWSSSLTCSLLCWRKPTKLFRSVQFM